MRTLKKVLALTVVLATMFSLTAFAGFTDADQINESCQDDINLMNALNVMVGDTEGTFRPNGTISRAEAAKMVYVVRNGGVDDKATGWAGMKVFTDVPSGAWYEGYVNYCASLGIIAGVGNNKFNPDGAVTGVELAKMLLVVAGYKPEVEGYTGANWSLNVIDDAQQANMFEGYAIAFSASAPRQWAAKLFSNTILKTQMALYLGGERVNGAAFMARDAQLVGEKYFTLKIANGVLMQIPHVNVNYNGGKSVLDNSNTSVIAALDTNQKSGEFVFNAPAELLGQEVKVIYKETSATDNGLDVKDTVYSMYATGTSSVYDTTMDAITLAVNDNNEATIKFDGYNGGKAALLGKRGTTPSGAPYDNRLTVTTNLYNTAVIGISASAGLDGKYTVDNKASLSGKSTAAVRLVDFDNNGILDFAFVTAPVYGTVRSYNADRFDFSTAAKFDNKAISSGRKEDGFKNFTFASNIAVDDVVRIDIDVTTGEVLYTVTKVEPTVGALTHVYSTATDNKIKVGGTDYGFFSGEFNGVAVALNAAGYSSDLGKELNLYTDGSYIFHATAGTGNVLGDNFAFVQGYNKNVTSVNGMNNSVTKVQLVLADGKNVICDYLNITGTDAAKYYTANEVTTGKDFVGKIVEYKMDGSNVTFYKEPTVAAGGDSNIVYANNGAQMTYSTSTGIFSRSNLSLRVNDNAVFFMPSYSGADFEYSVDEASDPTNPNVVIKSVSVFKGSELKGTPKMTPAASAFGKMDLISALQGGIPSVAYGVLDKDTNLSEAGTYAYTTTNSWKVTNDGKTTARVMAVLSDAADAEPVELTLKNNTDTAVGNKVYGVTKNSDGTYSLAELSTGAQVGGATLMNDIVKGVTADGKTVSIGSVLYNITKDTKVFVVDMANNVIGLGDITAAAKDEAGVQSYKNILCEIDNSNNLTTVYVEEYGASVEKLLLYRNSSITATNAITVADLQAGDNISTEAAAKALVGNLPAGVTLSSVTVAPVGSSNTGTTANVKANDKYLITITLAANFGYEFDNAAAAPAGGAITLKSSDTFAFSIEKTVAGGRKAVYKSAVQTKVDLTPATNKVTIADVEVGSLTSASTIADIVTALNADNTFKAAWKATAGDDKVVIEALTAGAIGSTGPANAPAGADQVVAGAEAVAATGTFVLNDTVSSLTVGGETFAKDTANTNKGTDTAAGVEATFDSATNTITFTATTPGAAANGEKTIDSQTITMAGGADAVKAKYEVSGIAAKITAATTTSGSLTIGGHTATLLTSTLAEQLDEFVADYNANATDKGIWEASVGSGDTADMILFTAKTAGAIDGNGPATAKIPAGTTEHVAGVDAE